MTHNPNDPRSHPAYQNNPVRRGIGSGTWIAVIVVVALLIMGAAYWGANRTTSTASGPSTATTTGSAPPATPAPPAPPAKQ